MAKIKDLAELLEKVQAQLAELSQRIERLETAGTKPAPARAAQPALPIKAPQPPKPEISEEEMLAISAAIAAYLGVRVHIRQIRLLSSQAWAQEGRVSIQASHNLVN
jgi:methylmalonyl-CoA carboxyltransferase 12S subunit